MSSTEWNGVNDGVYGIARWLATILEYRFYISENSSVAIGVTVLPKKCIELTSKVIGVHDSAISGVLGIHQDSTVE